jgi:hypothetical protein
MRKKRFSFCMFSKAAFALTLAHFEAKADKKNTKRS